MDTEVHDLVGAYAVDALADDERRFFERHLAGCEECAVEVAELRDTAALLAGAVAEEPPSGLRDRVLAAAATTEQERPVTATAQEPPPVDTAQDRQATATDLTSAAAARVDRGVRWRVLLPAVAAALVLLGGLTAVGVELFDTAGTGVEDQVATILEAPDGRSIGIDGPDGGTARLAWSAERGEGVFVTDGMAPAPAGHGYALWVIDGDTPSFAGLLRPDGEGHAVHALGEEVRRAEAVAVTVEPDDAPLDAPTTEPVMVGTL